MAVKPLMARSGARKSCEMAGDLLHRVRQLAVEVLHLFDQHHALQPGGHQRGILPDPGHLIGAEDGGERSGQQHDDAGGLLRHQGGGDGGLDGVAARSEHQDPGPGPDLAAEPVRLLDRHGVTGDDGGPGEGDESLPGAGHPQRPLQGLGGQRRPVRRENQEVVDGMLELLLFPVAPGAAQPGWRGETRIEQGDQRQACQGDAELDRWGGGGRAGGHGAHQDGDDHAVPQAQRPQPRLLDGRQPPRNQPHPDTGLTDAQAPHHHEGDQHGELRRGVLGTRARRHLDHDAGERHRAGDGHRRRLEATAEGDHGVAKEEEGQPGRHEDNQAEVAERSAQGSRDRRGQVAHDRDDAQAADGQRQVPAAQITPPPEPILECQAGDRQNSGGGRQLQRLKDRGVHRVSVELFVASGKAEDV
jgi:hypothetical protein